MGSWVRSFVGMALVAAASVALTLSMTPAAGQTGGVRRTAAGMPDFSGGILSDWTDGCVAVGNAEIEEIWKLVPNGAAVEILP